MKQTPEHISHLFYDDFMQAWFLQSNEEHQANVAALCREFADPIGLGDLAELAGLLHDKGKESMAFQNYIRHTSGFDTSLPLPSQHSHALFGSNILRNCYRNLQPLLGPAIAGHHRGLYDLDVWASLPAHIPSEIGYTKISKFSSYKLNGYRPEDISHLIRMLFSCLVDADYLDTERFMNPDKATVRTMKSSISDLLMKLESHLANLSKNAPDTSVNKLRREIQSQARKSSNCKLGFYDMTVPTGGGKTLASVLWAVHHAVANGLKRVIVAIPYTSIVTQTAQVLRNILGDENVLEHHSAIQFNDEEDVNRMKIKLATENWDCPIIVTTNVRLFESMFSHRPKDCRRLHNIAESVVILDEIQSLPMQLYEPLLGALNTYARCFKTSFLFTTASQPVLDKDLVGSNPFVKCRGLDKKPIAVVELNQDQLKPLDRVCLRFEDSTFSFSEIAHKLDTYDRVLCIVNTRRNAKEIFSSMAHDVPTLHLSRMMCSAHIRDTLDAINRFLASPDQSVRVVATQLVEAGVDIDFPVVYRQEAGLDSIIQAAGRCNREGCLPEKGETHVFALADANAMPPGQISHGNNARLSMKEPRDWFSPEAMREYFERLSGYCDTFDRDGICGLLDYRRLCFETASRKFRIIDDTGISVIVPYGQSPKLLDELKVAGVSKERMRRISSYCVNLRRHDLKRLLEAGAINEVEGIPYIVDQRFYDPEIGIVTDNVWLDETLIL